MKTVLISLFVFASQASFATTDLNRCHGKYLVSGPLEFQSDLDASLMQGMSDGVLVVTNKIVGSQNVVYAVEAASGAVLDSCVSLLTSVAGNSSLTVECNSELSF